MHTSPLFHPLKRIIATLSVRLSHTLKLVLLLDRVAIAASLRGVDQLFSQTLGDALDVAEGGFTAPDGQERDGLVDAAERRDVDSLAADCTSAADAGAVFAGAAVDNRVDGDLDRVLVRHYVDLEVLG